MLQITLNYWAILVAALVSFVIGGFWYSPLFMGKPWMKLMGIEHKSKQEMEAMRKKAMPAYVGSLVGSLLMAYVLAHFVEYMRLLDYEGDANAFMGVMTGFWIWLGFIAPVMFTAVLFANKPVKLWLIDTGYQLASMLAMGAILAAWITLRLKKRYSLISLKLA